MSLDSGKATLSEVYRMGVLILIRHGQSVWNAENRFTGWTDVELSERGVGEAERAGDLLSEIRFGVVHTSGLIRAQKTAEIIMSRNNVSGKIPVMKDQRLNERHYGDLQGLNKAETAEKHGAEQVHIWRRSFDVPPPGGESLKMNAERTIPYFEEEIVPDLKDGKNVLVSAHGNSLRSIVMHIESISPEEIVSLEIATGTPMFYKYDIESGELTRE
ncbi:MAG: 2,3-diphosphoglycerate-dependent phosphoglycerate mutase [Candidatus Thermoplasmatota archaeon]|jgi:2,3-bisphosphoglycerate-dependent phosphoglycerate mutase|nr:2,3-diphosphoglycerate-dependent phosphoglycerate mutase [Candidatus Thermoplasmatota archaeon]